MTAWNIGPAVGFDLESTGVDIETARIVTAAVVDREGAGGHWLANPGVDIPEEAARVHGISTEQAVRDGRPALLVVGEVAQALATYMGDGVPVVAFNGRYDFSLLDRECRRHGLATLEELLGRPVSPVIDPFIIDKQADKYRKGSRKLEALAAHYGVTLTDAHTADADALAALEVAVALAERFEQLRVNAETLHGWQVQWAAEQASSFRAYREKQGLPAGDIAEAWPVVPYEAPAPDLAAVLADLADRWEQLAKSVPDLGDELFIDKPSLTESLQLGRSHTYRRAAADVRAVLATGRIPHDLMTSAELGDDDLEQPVGGAL